MSKLKLKPLEAYPECGLVILAFHGWAAGLFVQFMMFFHVFVPFGWSRWSPNPHTLIYTCIYIYVHIYICICIYIYIYTYIYIYVHIYVDYVYIYIYMYMYIYIYIDYVHTRIYIYTQYFARTVTHAYLYEGESDRVTRTRFGFCRIRLPGQGPFSCPCRALARQTKTGLKCIYIY